MTAGNKICRLLDIRYPIIQAGMVWVSDWQLASACSNAGILGTIGTGSMQLDEISVQIENMHVATSRPFAVNIPMLRPDAPEIGALCLQQGVRIFITSAGNPDKIAPLLKRPDTLLIHVVPSVRGAVKSEKAGADAVVCEGYEAGGHNSPSEVTTFTLIPQVADAVKIPVIAAGGIADGRGIAAAMALGADAVQMGTRFIATRECPAHENHKKLIVEAIDTSTCIIGRKLDMLRVIRNDFASRIEAAEAAGADREALLKIIGSEFNRNRQASIEGNLKEGSFQAGQSAGIVQRIVTVEHLVKQLAEEYESARLSLQNWESEDD